jgi:hypothetical protein
MLKDDNIEITIHSKNQKQYSPLKVGDKIQINVNDLPKQSHVDITAICDICGKEKTLKFYQYNKNIKNYNIFACSKKCANIKRELTVNKIYGCKNVFQNENIKENIKNENIKKYGVSNLNKLDSQKIKIKNTIINKYGVENHFNAPEILEKTKKTNLERYGVENANKSNIIKQKIKNTNIKKYGFTSACKNELVKIKIKYTNLMKYGNENYMFSTEYLEKRKNFLLKKYNISLIENNFPIYKLKCNICNNNYDICINTLHKRLEYKTILCTNCNPIKSSSSGYEIQLQNFIKENYNKTILFNNRTIISKELDIYLPDVKLAFEFNGLFWHSELYKDNNYHLNKTKECEKNGIQLIHIYEDDWIYKQDVIKSMIINKLNKTKNKIYARKCKIKEIYDDKLIKGFISKNNIEVYVDSKIKIGLFYENVLVCLMLFNNINNKDYYELSNFSVKINTNIIGGASKLLKYFINNYNPKKITTYVNRSYSQGNLYKILGFNFINKCEPNFYYIINGTKINKNEINTYKNAPKIYDSGYLKFTI